MIEFDNLRDSFFLTFIFIFLLIFFIFPFIILIFEFKFFLLPKGGVFTGGDRPNGFLDKTGAITAKGTYGVQEGWVAHGFTDNRMGCGMLGETRTTDKQTDR